MQTKFFVRLIVLSAMLFLMAMLSACDKPLKKSEVVLSTTTTEESSSQEQSTTVTTKPTDENSTDDEVFDESKIDTYVILNDENTIINGIGAGFENNVLTITESGTYSLTGTLSNGKVYVNCDDEQKKVKLYLNGVTISCTDDAPIFVENSPKETILILADGTVNTLTDSSDREIPTDGSDYATATVYSKDDLQIEGTGTLNVTADFNKGIFSKNDIDIKGGIINITSADDGIRGKDSVEISNGNITITSTGDGIRTSEELEEDKGDIVISGGNINITSTLDGIQATRNLALTGGTVNVNAGGGATQPANDTMGGMPGNMHGQGGNRGNKGGGFFFGGMPNDSSAYEQTVDDTPSTKGIKAAYDITLSECSLTVDAADDAIHANNITVNSGMYSIKSTDDGIHADTELNVSGGNINISLSYEGLEAQSINISDGKINLVSTDDGFNATSSNSTSSMMPGGPNSADSSCIIDISGGYVFMDAEGDGVDSNGNVNMTGGTLIVYGPQSGGNGALDYAGQFKISGGTLLAVGSAGMAQSVSGENSIKVYAYNYSQQAQTLSVITDDNGEVVIGFKSTKPFSTMVLASDKFDSNGTYTLYNGGTIEGEENDVVYFEGKYTGGTQVGVLS